MAFGSLCIIFGLILVPAYFQVGVLVAAGGFGLMVVYAMVFGRVTAGQIAALKAYRQSGRSHAQQ